ncbi:FAD-dependent oxidoreductase, partial [Microbacterium sp. CPCC 204701]|uniref:FAD-dependent oxidoreductase n=1 Tax=Microbacterium sp. CPCC 204701 TaxID=2493084 RepID=UPI00237BEBCB
MVGVGSGGVPPAGEGTRAWLSAPPSGAASVSPPLFRRRVLQLRCERSDQNSPLDHQPSALGGRNLRQQRPRSHKNSPRTIGPRGDAGVAEVTIVGAGPVGMLLAGELVRCGVDVELLERRPAAGDGSRAIGVH